MSKPSLLKTVKEQSPSNLRRWKKYAINHIMHIMACPAEMAEKLYASIREEVSPNIILNIELEDFSGFLCGEEYRQKDNEIRRQARTALNIESCYPTWASITKNCEGDRRFGSVSLILEGVKEYLVFQGDPSRLRDPSRVDFLTDPIEGLFDSDYQNDCRAISTILAMGPHELTGIQTAIANAQSETVDLGRCTALIFDQLTPDNIARIYVSKQADLEGVRSLLDKLSKAIPVDVSNKGIRQKDPFSYREDDDIKIKPSALQHYFCVGDRICTKRTVATSPLVPGTIIDIANGQVTIQWDHDKRSIIDWAEALMTLIPQPDRKAISEGDVIYATPGMDSKTIKLLSIFNIDPITVYSLATHCLPVGQKIDGWKDKLQRSMANIGITGSFKKGYTETDSYFEPNEWFESKLPSGLRIIIDFSDSKPKVIAGEAEEYVNPSDFPILIDE
jgi:hypothetical protein